MNFNSLLTAAVVLFSLLCTGNLVAASSSDDALSKRIADLEARLARIEASFGKPPAAARPAGEELAEMRRELQILATEVEKLRSGETEVEVSESKLRSLGVAPSAGSIYRKKQGVSIAGYGEMLYENPAARSESGAVSGRSSQFDFLRAVLYTGYRFSDKFVFNSEIEFEHASTGKGGEASVEFAYLDYLASPYLSLRGGLLLVPMGLTNEYHEPNAYLGVKRSETETRIIPSTWRENGFGAHGSAGMFRYRAYVINGLDAAGFSSDGLRGGRQKGASAKASDLAFVGRLDLQPTSGLFFGGSLYRGGSSQGQYIEAGRALDVTTTIGEVHGQFQMRGWDARALFARAVVGDAAALSRLRNLTGRSAIAERMQGGYLQLGYNILSQVRESVRLTPYYRFEKVDTHARISPLFSVDPARNRTFHTAGLEFRPIGGIVLKSDYQWARNRSRSGVNQFNVGLGYAF